jgi:hypothetical protein
MSKITITKAKLLKGDKLEIEFTRLDKGDEKPTECFEKHTSPPKDSLRDAFAALSVHAAIINEFIVVKDNKEFENIDTSKHAEQLKKFTTTGITIHHPGEDEEGVTLTAYKELKSGKIFVFNTNMIVFTAEGENAYPYVEDLMSCVDACRDEVTEYLNGNYKPDPQIKLELN